MGSSDDVEHVSAERHDYQFSPPTVPKRRGQPEEGTICELCPLPKRIARLRNGFTKVHMVAFAVQTLRDQLAEVERTLSDLARALEM